MLLIQNAKVLTMCGPTIEGGDILIDGRKIIQTGKDLTVPEGCTIIDATGLLAAPGFIDAHCHMGLCSTGSDYSLYDCNECSDPITPHMRAVDGYDPRQKSLKSALRGGVTTIMTGPGSSNIIGGQFAIFKTAGGTIEESLVKAPAAMKAAFGQNPMRIYGKEQKHAPITRMGIAAQMREFLRAAKNYALAVDRAQTEADKPAYNEKYEAMLPVFRNEIPMKIHAHRVDDMSTAIRICTEFGLSFTLDHCTQAHVAATEFRGKLKGAIVGPFVYVPDKQEVEDVHYGTAAALHKQGIKVAIASDWPIWPMDLFGLQAGLAIRDGLTEEDVWKMVTINPAEILGIDSRVGSLEPGKDADIVLYCGNPLRDVGTYAQITIINGQIVYSAGKE